MADKSQWEYRIMGFSWPEEQGQTSAMLDEWEKELNQAGLEGWELVGLVPRTGVAISNILSIAAYFKRPLP